VFDKLTDEEFASMDSKERSHSDL